MAVSNTSSTSTSSVEALKLLAESRGQLMLVAANLTRDHFEQEDLVMRTIERALSRIDSFDPAKGTLLTWMTTILRNIYVSDQRGKARNALDFVDQQQLADELSPIDTTTDDEILAHSDHDELRKAIAKLRPEEREAVVMFYFLDLPIARMAKILACPVGTVKSRLARARIALREILAHRIGTTRLMVAILLLAALFGAVFRPAPDPASPDPASPDPASPDPASPIPGRAHTPGAPQSLEQRTPPLVADCSLPDSPIAPSSRIQSLISYAKREGLALYGKRADGTWELTRGDEPYLSYSLDLEKRDI